MDGPNPFNFKKEIVIMDKLNQFGAFRLSRSEMKSIMGGARYRCQCEGSVGRWEGTYGSNADAVAAGTGHCSSGVATCSEISE